MTLSLTSIGAIDSVLEWTSIIRVLIYLRVESVGQLSAKKALAVKLNTLLDNKKLSQTEAAGVLGIPQPKISAIRNYKLRGISLERPMQALTALGQHVEIVVKPSSRQTPAPIRVVA